MGGLNAHRFGLRHAQAFQHEYRLARVQFKRLRKPARGSDGKTLDYSGAGCQTMPVHLFAETGEFARAHVQLGLGDECPPASFAADMAEIREFLHCLTNSDLADAEVFRQLPFIRKLFIRHQLSCFDGAQQDALELVVERYGQLFVEWRY